VLITAENMKEAELLTNPILELNLVKMKGTQRKSSILRTEMSFVPFLTGKLILEYDQLEIMEPGAIAKQSHGGEDSFNGIIRFVLADDLSNFQFSDPFTISRKGGKIDPVGSDTVSVASTGKMPKMSGSSRILSKFDKPSSRFSAPPGKKSLSSQATTNKVSLPINTLQFMNAINTHSVASRGPLLPLMVEFMQMNEGDLGVTNRVAVGYISTAAVYFPAVRTAASSSLYTSMNDSSSGFASPTYSVQVNLMNTQNRKCVAILNVNMKFIVDEIDVSTIEMIEKSIDDGSGGNISEPLKMELELKKSFLAADTDKSGQVTSQEVKMWYFCNISTNYEVFFLVIESYERCPG